MKNKYPMLYIALAVLLADQAKAVEALKEFEDCDLIKQDHPQLDTALRFGNNNLFTFDELVEMDTRQDHIWFEETRKPWHDVSMKIKSDIMDNKFNELFGE